MAVDSTIGTTDLPSGLVKLLRMFQHTVGGNPVHSEAIVQVDPTDAAAAVAVKAGAPSTGDYGAVMRSPDGGIVALGTTTDVETVNTLVGLLKRVVSRLVGNIPAAAVLQAVPTSSTALIGSTCNVLVMLFANTTASAVTVTVTDGAGSPVAGLQSFSVPANSFLRLEWNGASFTSGVKWSAGGAGVNGAVIAYQ